MRRFAPFFSVLLLVWSAPATAAADEATPRPARVRDALHGDALASFDRGNALFQEGDAAGARAQFLQATELGGDPRVLYNVAVCDKAQRRYARALRELNESLERGGTSLPKRYIQTVQDTIALLRPLVSSLSLRVDEPGATVSVDDEPRGTTPFADPLVVEVGEHVVTVRKPGFQELRRRVEVTSAPTALGLQLEPLVRVGQLSVRAHGLGPGVAGVALVDNVEVGPVPWSGPVAAGLHTVGVRARGYIGANVGLDIPYRGNPDVDVEMKPELHQGRLRVSTGDADILVDGKVVGHGEFDGVVSAGEHTLRIARSGAIENNSDIVVREGETRSVSIQLAASHEVPTWLWIAGGVAVVGGATVAVLLLTEKTHYEGSSAGTLPPGVVPAAFHF